MQVEIKIDPGITTPRAVIYTKEITKEIRALVQKLSEQNTCVISGFQQDEV